MMKTMFSLRGKTVVLTGATGFFGRYFAEVLAEYGARVVLVDKSIGNLSVLEKELKKKYGKNSAVSYVLDLYDKDQSEKVYLEILDKEKEISVLMNNAFDFGLKTGFNDEVGKLENSTFNQLQSSFESGIYWAVLATKIFGFDMKNRGVGSIINTCSMYATIVPSPDLYEGTDRFNPPGYSMAKAGLLQFTKYSAAFLGPEVRVNAVSPGAFPISDDNSPNAIDENNPVLSRLNKKTLLKRMGHPKDLIGAVVYLASDASSYVTGQNIIIDGGITVT